MRIHRALDAIKARAGIVAISTIARTQRHVGELSTYSQQEFRNGAALTGISSGPTMRIEDRTSEIPASILIVTILKFENLKFGISRV
jgi:hypothetical protein